MEAAIDNCCGLRSLTDNWSVILQISDTYAVGQPKQCLKTITKKIFQENPHVSLKAITLLDACVKNAGNTFARELSSRDFTNTFKQKYQIYFSLLITLFTWVREQHPAHVRELEAFLSAAKKEKRSEIAKTLQAEEEENLAKAIAASLTETTNRPSTPQQQQTVAASVTYPGLLLTNAGPPLELGKVRALFDFEAAEDNELTFKAGDLITLLDESDANWWKGSNRKGEGLFPAQFVEKVGSKEGDTKTAEENDAGSASHDHQPIKIEPQLIKKCFDMLGDADPTGVARPDPANLLSMEQRCRQMEPLIEAELEGVDLKISDVETLKQQLMEALGQYNDLVARMPVPPPMSYSGMPYRVPEVPYQYNACPKPPETAQQQYATPQPMLPDGRVYLPFPAPSAAASLDAAQQSTLQQAHGVNSPFPPAAGPPSIAPYAAACPSFIPGSMYGPPASVYGLPNPQPPMYAYPPGTAPLPPHLQMQQQWNPLDSSAIYGQSTDQPAESDSSQKD